MYLFLLTHSDYGMAARHDPGVEPGIIRGWVEVFCRLLGGAADDDLICI